MPRRKPPNEATSKDIESLSDDYLALVLLDGILQKNPDGTWRRDFLSKDTRPTEDEARAALARLLLSKNPPTQILWALASIISPDEFDRPDKHRPPEWMFRSLRERRAIFRHRNQGHPETARHFEIALEVFERRESGETYEAACESVAEAFGLGPRQVQAIWAKLDLEIFYGPLPRARKRPAT